MDVQTFVLFANEVISENMTFLLENVEHSPSLGGNDEIFIDQILVTSEHTTELVKILKRIMLEQLTERELLQAAYNHMQWSIIAWADSDEFKLHELANKFIDEFEAAQ